jgi:hypothetical protein
MKNQSQTAIAATETITPAIRPPSSPPASRRRSRTTWPISLSPSATTLYRPSGAAGSATTGRTSVPWALISEEPAARARGSFRNRWSVGQVPGTNGTRTTRHRRRPPSREMAPWGGAAAVLDHGSACSVSHCPITVVVHLETANVRRLLMVDASSTTSTRNRLSASLSGGSSKIHRRSHENSSIRYLCR